MILKHIHKGTIYVYIVEGKAEEYIIESLIDSKRIIDWLRPNDIYHREIIVAGGSGNLNYCTFIDKTKLNQRDKRNAHFVIVGDKLKPEFTDCCTSDVIESYGENFEDRITYITIDPEPELILIQKILGESRGLDTSSKVKKKFEEMPVSFNDAKSYKYWEDVITRKDIADCILATTFKERDNKPRNMLSIFDVVVK